MPAAQAAVQEHTLDGVIYEVDPTDVSAGAVAKACVPRNEMPSTELHFPYAFQTPDDNIYTIRSIAPSACSDRGITALTLPSGLETLGSRSFENNSITTIEIPRWVETIPWNAFAQNIIKTIDFGDFSRLKVIESSAFYFNDLNGTLKLPKSLRQIGDSAFAKNALQVVEFEENINTIERNAFRSNWISRVDLPQSIRRVEAGAFDDNSYLTRVQLEGAPPAAVTSTTFGPPSSVLVHIHRELGYPEPPALWSGYTTQYLENYVTFDSQGGSNVQRQTVNYGAKASPPANPARDNYSFTGWYTDEATKTGYEFGTPVVENLTLYAGWKVAEYAVDFDSQGGTAVSSQIVEYGKTASAPTQPTQANHTFTGWYTDKDTKNKYDFATPVTGALTLYAGWKIDTYTVTFNSQGGSAVAAATVDHGKAVAEPAKPSREGYALTGWYTDKEAKNPYDFAAPVTGALTLYAGWSLNTYDVTFDSQGGTAVAKRTVEHGKPVASPADPSREGHTFTGWYTDKEAKTKYDFATPVTSAVTLYAGWQIDTYTVTFDSQGGTAIAAATVDHGKAVSEPAKPVREGYALTGWYTDKDATAKYDFATPVTGALTLYAGWSLNTYDVTFDSQGGTAVAKSTVDHGKPVASPADPTREGHTFTGWYTDKEAKTKYDFATPVTSALTLYAGWKIDTYTVTFDSQGGTAVAASTVDHGKPLSEPAKPTREGYAFTGWYTDNDTKTKYDFAAPVTGALTLYAGWSLNTYDVTFDSQGGSAVAKSTVDHGKPVASPADPTREGHTFTGWYTDKDTKNKYDFATPVTGALTLYAGWKIDIYTVTFDSQGGSVVASSTVDHGKAVEVPAKPNKKGHAFTGWYTDADATSPYDFDAPVTASVTLFAGWTVDTYVMTFATHGGSEVASVTVAYGELLPQPAAPTREHYSFAGWYTDAETTIAYDFATPVSGPVTLHAAWKIDTVSVTFDTRGGSATKAETIDYGSRLVVPSTPQRDGYVFTGWHTDEAATVKYDFSTPVTEPFTLYAGWKAIEGNAGANGGDSNGKGDATGTRPTSPGGLTNTGSNGVPMGVFIGVGAIVILGAGLAFMGIRKRRQASTDDVSTDGENTDSL